MIRSLPPVRCFFIGSAFLLIFSAFSLLLTPEPTRNWMNFLLTVRAHVSNGHENGNLGEDEEIIFSQQEMIDNNQVRDNSRLGLRILLITIAASLLGFLIIFILDKKKRKKGLEKSKQ